MVTAFGGGGCGGLWVHSGSPLGSGSPVGGWVLGSRVHTLYIGYEPVNPEPNGFKIHFEPILNPVNLAPIGQASHRLCRMGHRTPKRSRRAGLRARSRSQSHSGRCFMPTASNTSSLGEAKGRKAGTLRRCAYLRSAADSEVRAPQPAFPACPNRNLAP